MKKTYTILAVILLLSCVLFFSACDLFGEKITITFNSQGGSSVKSQTIVEETGQATEPDAPTRKGYTFGGWYISKECNDGEKFSFNTVITNDLTLYAKWIEASSAFLFNFTLSPDGKGYIIMGYTGSETTIFIPFSYNSKPVTGIGSYAFKDCSNLTSITIPNNITSIEQLAFAYCTNLTSITIPNSVTNIGVNAFYGCDNLNYEEYGNCLYLNNWLIKAKNTSVTSITLKSNTIGIAGGAFSDCSNLTSIIIPNGVTSIGDYAFAYCSSLTSITIPDSIKNIGENAFDGCDNLNYEEYGNCLYLNNWLIKAKNTSVTSVTLKGNTIGIAGGAFSGCSSLTSVIIPNGVTSIGDSAFYNCSSLTSINVNSNNPNYKSIDGNLYTKDGKTLIQYAIGKTAASFVIPDSVTSIEASAFYDCSSLTSVTIGNSVTNIGELAFYDCSNLTSVTIGNSVTSIGDRAFAYCSSLTSINVNSNNPNYKSIDGNLYTKDGTTLIQYAIGKTSVSFVIPDSVTSIGYVAFAYCSRLTSVTIGNNVTSIGFGTFAGCSNLTIYCRTASKPAGWDYYWNPDNRPVVWGYTG